MKKLLTTILLIGATWSANAQLQLIQTNGSRYYVTTNTYWMTIPGVSTGLVAVINSNLVVQGDTAPEAWTKANANFGYLQTNNPLASYTNGVQTTSYRTLFYTNPFAFGASNYIGKFTNVYSFTSSIISGTNSTTNLISLDGTSFTNFYITNPFTLVVVTNNYTNTIGTNSVVVQMFQTNTAYQGVWLSVLSSTGNTGAVTVATLDAPSRYNTWNQFRLQAIDADYLRVQPSTIGSSTAGKPYGAGQILFDDNYLYLATTNGWRRIAIPTNTW